MVKRKKIPCEECGNFYTEKGIKKHKTSAHPVKIYQKPLKPIEFIPEIIHEIISYLPIEKKIHFNFIQVSKQFHQVYFESNYSSWFKVNKIYDENFGKLEKEVQLSLFKQTKELIESKVSKLKSIEKKKEFNKKWMELFDDAVFQKLFSNKSQKLVEDVPNHLDVISFEKNEIHSEYGIYQYQCHVRLFDKDLHFESTAISHPSYYSWSVSHIQKEKLINYESSSDYSCVRFRIKRIQENFKMDLSDDEMIDLLNGMSFILIDNTCWEFTTSQSSIDKYFD